MTDELTERAARAVADFEHAADFLKGPYFEAVVGRALAATVQAQQSPWVNRAGAAARCHCSVSEIDRAKAAGIITCYQRGGTPLYLKHDLDEAIRGGRWRLK